MVYVYGVVIVFTVIDIPFLILNKMSINSNSIYMTRNMFKMILCTGAGIITAVGANLDRIPTGDDLQWTVDNIIPFAFGFGICYGALTTWQWLGDHSFHLFKKGAARYWENLWRSLL